MRTKRAIWSRQNRLRNGLAPFHRTVAQFGYFGSILAVVSQRIGVECGDPRRPLRPLRSDERETLLAQVEDIGIWRAFETVEVEPLRALSGCNTKHHVKRKKGDSMFKRRIALFRQRAAGPECAPLAEAKTFYWISHGSPADPVWTYFLAGAQQWSQDTGHEVNTSFHNGDVASHQEAVRAAIAAGADGIVTSSPDPGSLVQVAQEANEANIPIINMNTPDPTASFDAYVGGDLVTTGRQWAQYLVDKGHVQIRRLRVDAGGSARRDLWSPRGTGRCQCL